MVQQSVSTTSSDEKRIVEEPSNSRLDRTASYRDLMLLAITSLGVIYGDIGTSPIYTVNAIFPASGDLPSNEDIIGGISAIIWALTLVPLLKYCLIALNFGNSSREGGPLALFTSLYPPRPDTDENRTLTNFPTFSSKLHQSSSKFFERKSVKTALFGWVLFAIGCTIADGMLTPAVSVVSAVGGIAVGAPGVAESVVPIAVAILLALFVFQAVGTQRVGLVFAPVIIIFFAIIAISGMINIAAYPGIFRAIDPSRAIMWFVRTGKFDNLAAVLLAVTGSEAMFANLGQFSKQSIRIGFIGYVFPCLVFAYLGQGARLVTGGVETQSNVYFQSIPGGIGSPFYWITFVFTILAAIIASQAMISATFSLVQQLVHFHAMPAVKVIHTSSFVQGQVFVPVINVLLCIGTLGLVGGFGTGAGLTAAYGFAVSTVFIVTTTFIAISIVRVKHLPVILAIAFALGMGFIDVLFWGASVKKIPEGAYVPLALAVLISSFLFFWSWARGLEDRFDVSNRNRLSEVIKKVDNSEDRATEVGKEGTGGVRIRVPSKSQAFDGDLMLVGRDLPLSRLPIFAFFHNQSGNTMDGTPHSFAAFLRCYPSLPQVIIFLSIMTVERAYTTEEERYVVSRVRAFDGVYTAKIFLGYRDVVDLTNIAQPIFEAIKSLERSSDDSQAEERISSIQDAMKQSVTHILPHFYVSSKLMSNKVVDYVRRFLIEGIYRRLQGDDAAGYVMKEESVLRMGVAADL